MRLNDFSKYWNQTQFAFAHTASTKLLVSTIFIFIFSKTTDNIKTATLCTATSPSWKLTADFQIIESDNLTTSISTFLYELSHCATTPMCYSILHLVQKGKIQFAVLWGTVFLLRSCQSKNWPNWVIGLLQTVSFLLCIGSFVSVVSSFALKKFAPGTEHSDWKSRAASAQSFALWQQATIEITCHDHSYCLFAPHICMVLFFEQIPF